MQGVSSLPNCSALFRPVINYDHFVGSSITLFPSPFTLNGLVSLALFGTTLLLSLHLQVYLFLFALRRFHSFPVIECHAIRESPSSMRGIGVIGFVYCDPSVQIVDFVSPIWEKAFF